MMSGDESFGRHHGVQDASILSDAFELPSVVVPAVKATPETLGECGKLVSNFDAEDVHRVTWPKSSGWRPIVNGTGNLQALIEGDFRVRWIDDIMYGDNLAAGVTFKIGYPCGRLINDGSRSHILVREVNYHPDGGQVFFPPPGQRPYVLLLAPASVGDDVRPEHFQAFHFDGTTGFQIFPGVWHFVPYFQPPEHDGHLTGFSEMTFRNKQSSVYACVAADTVKEFGVYMKVPLKIEM